MLVLVTVLGNAAVDALTAEFWLDEGFSVSFGIAMATILS